MNIEQINQAKQKVSEKEAAFNAALESENTSKIKVAATELSEAKLELSNASKFKISPAESKANLETLYKEVKILRESGKGYEAMELLYSSR